MQRKETVKDEFGINFCYHNHGFEFYPYENGTLYDYFVQKTKPAYVSFEMDILWIYFGGGNPAELLNKYGNRYKLMYLKDLRKSVDGNLSGSTAVENDVTLGTEQLDIPGILKAPSKAGVVYYYIEDESPDYFNQVRQTMAYLKRLTS